MIKKVLVSARIDEEKFDDFKWAYIEKLRSSLQKADPVITGDMLQVSNSELVDRAISLAIAYLAQQEL